MAVPYDLSSFDPHAKNGVGAYEVLSAVYEPLVTLDRSMRPVPALAVSWETPDPLTWVFRLRPGVRFHDGSPLTVGGRGGVAAAPRHGRAPGDALLPERRGRGHRPGERTPWSCAPSGRTRSWRAVSTSPSSSRGARPPSRWRSGPTAPGRSRSPGGSRRRWRSQRNRLYWGEAAGASRVRIDFGVPAADAVAAGDPAPYDLIVGARRAEEEARRSGRYRIVEVENIFLRHLAFDVARERTPFCPGIPNPFRKPEVREAINLALDRERLAAAAGAGARPAYQLVPRAVFGHDPGLPPVVPDPARARALLAQAGSPHGFDVVLHRPRGYSTASEMVREQLAASGSGCGSSRCPAPSSSTPSTRGSSASGSWRAGAPPATGSSCSRRASTRPVRAGWASTTTATIAARTSTGGSSRREASSTCARARRPCRASSSGCSRTASGSRSTTTAARCCSRGASLYEPRADGYLRMADIRRDPAASR